MVKDCRFSGQIKAPMMGQISMPIGTKRKYAHELSQHSLSYYARKASMFFLYSMVNLKIIEFKRIPESVSNNGHPS